MPTNLRCWRVMLSYRIPKTNSPGRRYRDNLRIGVVAETIERAIEAAKQTIPTGGDCVRVWAAQDQGAIDVLALEDNADESIEESVDA